MIASAGLTPGPIGSGWWPSRFLCSRGFGNICDAFVDDELGALPFTTPASSSVRIAVWRHRVWEPAANAVGMPAGTTPSVLRRPAASLMAQRGVPVSAVAAALGRDPVTFLRTDAHLYPGTCQPLPMRWTSYASRSRQNPVVRYETPDPAAAQGNEGTHRPDPKGSYGNAS
jgi:hypothetical protein